MFEESIISMFSFMSSWLTPTVLFLLLNLMIGTIAVTSGLTSKPTTTSPSVLHRLRSIKLYTTTAPPEPLFHLAGNAAAADDPDLAGKAEQEEPEHEAVVLGEEEGPTMDEVFSRIQQGNAAFGRSKSDRGRRLPEPKKVRKRIIKKAASEVAAGFEAVPEMEPTAEQIRQWAGPDDEVDGKAEDFITRFRQQLSQQRQDSIYGAAA